MVRSILDAHPNATISNELDVIGALEHIPKMRSLLYALIESNARVLADKGNQWTEYDYSIHSGWQGRGKETLVLGDKKGGVTGRRLAQKPELFEQLEALVGIPIKVIHVVRHPLDMIATSAVRSRTSVDASAQRVLRDAQNVIAFSQRQPDTALITLYHEDLLHEPTEVITQLCTFLGLPITDSYLDACINSLHTTPHQSRRDVEWTTTSLDLVRELCESNPYFVRYANDLAVRSKR